MEHRSLLVTDEVAELLHVHPKQIYRLLARGLPGHRVGREWRFDRDEVLRWVERGAVTIVEPTVTTPTPVDGREEPPPLVAANGDVAVERLLARTAESDGAILGFVLADRDRALDLLRRGRVLLAGSHGKEPPEEIGDVRLARIHLVQREIGLVGRHGAKAPDVCNLGGGRFASRPTSAGIRVHLDAAMRKAKLDASVLDRAVLHSSHRDVVHAVSRGDADFGLTTRAWAARLGLPFRRVATEPYGLVLRAGDLGDARVVRLCAVAQSAAFRADLAAVPGYDPTDSGAVQFHFA